jgi:hypothetical protein
MSVVTPFKGEEPTSMRLATPMAMLDRAIEQGAGVEVLAKLMDLQERHEKAQARKAFDAAIADAKNKMPRIDKNRSVDFTSAKGRTNYKYEDLAEIARTIDPVLGEFGLSYRFRTNVQNGTVVVTCIVSHRDGHSEENSLPADIDTSGNKNHLQAVGSAVTYLSRYTLKAALGLAASNDDDGRAAGRPLDTISVDQKSELIDALDLLPAGSEGRLLASLGLEELSDIPSAEFAKVLRSVKNKAAK